MVRRPDSSLCALKWRPSFATSRLRALPTAPLSPPMCAHLSCIKVRLKCTLIMFGLQCGRLHML